MITLLVHRVDGEIFKRQIADDCSLLSFAQMVHNSELISHIEIISVSPSLSL